ncbi:MAG TPA: sigma-54 dependent transcriptional regulator [Humidesulfovibrio sp.]|uniref:sigma-54-dependent transcriptional regulator n=1 Tax=Humidesulfovibrio sp. TaxID=2910988 RepID=UPI002D0F4B67|nr:sigma-54 dependent transcriptional regulator [Humidesulfovibrio sp.]HWR02579.1 sigma-54 dependent transcriptional regulator [Humidesulfovibrio sp.]
MTTTPATGSGAALVVDDQRDFAVGLSRLLAGQFPDWTFTVRESGAEALQELEHNDYSLLITDLRMPGISGQNLLTAALARNPALTVIMLTAFGSVETAVAALKEGAYDFLTKPIDQEHLFRIVGKAMERSQLLMENMRLREKAADTELGPMLIGESQAMRRLRKSILAVAASDYTVLIRGESGTGKELVARSIQALGHRANAPFVTVNCPAIPDSLLESELFGHVKGAFTGADKNRKGLFMAANRGTILLDEIGDIPGGVQTKLLRVIQEGEVRPVGTNEAAKVNVRILASTNQNLEAKISDQSFREDLYFRLNVLAIHVPPLRERTEDIPRIASHFLLTVCRELGVPPKELSDEAVGYLACRSWPGNVRELLNLVRRLAVFCPGDRIEAAHVRQAETGAPLPSACEPFSPYKETKQMVVEEFTRSYVHRLLEHTQGNISEAARISGVERFSLQKILKRMNINTGDYRKG